MGNSNRKNNLIILATKIIYDDYNEKLEDEFLNQLEQKVISTLDDSNIIWILNALNFMQINNVNNRVKFLKIETCKLRILSSFVADNEYLKGILKEDDLHTDEIYEKNDQGAIIYKQYIPNSTSIFYLPHKGEKELLTIVSFDDMNNEYTAKVLIDELGMVLEVVEPLSLSKETKQPSKFDDLYTDLLTDVLNEN